MIRSAAISKRRCHLSVVVASLLLASLGSPAIFLAADDSNRYPEKGKVVAAGVSERTEYVPVSPPDSKGRSSGGEAFVSRNWLYRVETGDDVYEFEGGKKQSLKTGDAIEFRVEKNSVHLRAGAKEVKYRLLSGADLRRP
jgi:hypothetical protein